MAQHHREQKEINTAEVVRFLSRAFNRAATQAASAIGSKAVRTVDGKIEPTLLYDYQVEFCYLVDNIQRGPKYIAPKYIQEANEMIARLAAEG